VPRVVYLGVRGKGLSLLLLYTSQSGLTCRLIFKKYDALQKGISLSKIRLIDLLKIENEQADIFFFKYEQEELFIYF